MRCRIAASIAASAALAAGCGGDRPSPVGAAASYLPPDAALVVIVETDLDSAQVESFDRTLGGAFTDGEGLEEVVRRDLQAAAPRGGVDFDRDVRPLLGDELVVGFPAGTFDRRNDHRGEDVVAALRVRDEKKLLELLPKLGLEPAGERGGARLFGEKPEPGEPLAGPALAVEDAVVVAATSERALTAALDRRDRGGHMTEQRLTAALADLN